VGFWPQTQILRKGDRCMPRREKITWDKIFKDFKDRYPKRGIEVLGFRPHDYATILLFFPNGVRQTYNYDTKRLTQIDLRKV
jgi:hypothetical protein